MKYHALFVIFEKAAKFENCRLVQILDSSLWVKISQIISPLYMYLITFEN